MKKLLVIFILLTGILSAQSVPKDTSYTPHSAAKKMYKKFPEAKLVSPMLPEGIKAEENIVYKKIGDRDLHLNIYYPETAGAKTYPGVLMIHGGGWISGDESLVIPMAQRLAARGYVTVTVEYRLTPEALYPAGVYDLKAAVRWMKANGNKYHIDTGRIASYGCSAGGELASFLGTTGNLKMFNKGEFPNISSAVQAVVNVDGLLDFTNINSTKYDDNPEKPSAAHKWFGASYKDKPGIWKEASPITYVSKNCPPIIFINSGQPHYHAGRDDAINLLKNYGIYFKQHTFEGTRHTFWLFSPWFEKTLDLTDQFLKKTLKDK